MINIKSIVLKFSLALGILAGSANLLSAQTTTNILDTFNRNGALNGTAPDIAQTSGDVWAASSTTQLVTANTPDGRLIYTGSGSYAKLPFIPQSGYVYTLSLTMNIANTGSTADRWGAFGFDNGTQNGAFNCGNTWLLCKFDGTVQAFDHALTDNFYAGSAGTAFKNGTNNLLQFVLDTTAASWKVQVKVNGAAVGPVHTLASTSITKVSIWGNSLNTAGRNATNQLLSVTSIQPQAPSITGQPVGLTNWAGVTASLSVAATGAQPIDYYWFKGSIANPVGGNASTLSFSPLAGTDSGSYFVICSNYLGSVTSSVVNLHAETTTVMALTPRISVVALPAIGTDAASGLTTNNTYISALDFGNDTSALSINDVVFQQIDPTGLQSTNNVDSTYGGSWALSKSTVNFTTLSGASNDASAQADGSSLSLLNDALGLAGTVNIDDSITVSLGGVVPTGQYSLCVYYRNWDSLPQVSKFTFNGQGSNEVVTLDQDLGASVNSGGAYYVKYNFTAISNTVSVTLAGSQAGRSARIYATTLQQISAPLVAPTITLQPQGFTNWAGVSGSLSVTANGSLPLRYQWFQNGTLLSGQTSATLNFASLSTNDSGSYTVVITNNATAPANVVTSSVANVQVYQGTWSLTPSISLVQIPAVGSDTGSGLDATNLYLAALDFGSDTTALSVNGVNFTQISVTGNGTGTGTLPVFSGTDANYGARWSLTASNSATDQSGFGSVASGGAAVQADGSLATLLSDMSYLRGGIPAGNYAKLTLSGLAPGAQYAFRYYYRQWGTARPVVFTFNGRGTNESAQVDLDGGGANYIDYQFTAASTNLDITMTAVNAGNGPHIYGVTLQQTAPAPIPPSIATQPVGFTNWVNYSGSLTVSVTGSLPFGYQWYQNGSPLSGQTSATLSFPSLADTDAGAYKVIVSNLSGSVTSSVVNVSVITNGVWTLTPSLSVIQIPASGSDAASGIDSTNTYVAALDFGSDTAALSINGVNFTQISITGAGTGTGSSPVFSGADANYGGTWSLTASNSAVNDSGFGSVTSGGSAVQADGSLQALLTDMSYLRGTLPAGNYAKLTLGGLTPGAQYAFRYYYRQWGTARPIDFTFGGQGTNETMRVDLDGGGANYVNYQFTAVSTNLDVTMTAVNAGNGPHIYGVTLQQTAPAPGPTLTSVTPNPVKGSSHPVTLSLTGSGFTGATAVLLTNTTAATGASYTPTVNSATSISVNFVPGTTASTWNATVVNGSPSAQVGFTVSVPSPVQITQTSVNSAGAGKVVLNGTGGTAGYSYVVVGATNLNPPVVWSPMVTNTFDVGGNFYYTNTVDAAKTALFLRIEQ